MIWLIAIIGGITILYILYIVMCWIHWNSQVVHRYFDKEEMLFLVKNGKVYWGGLTFREMFVFRPICSSEKLEWRGFSRDKLDALIYDQCIDDYLDLLGPRSYHWMHENPVPE